MIYFTSDLHFGHENIIKYCSRPFKSVREMNSALIANWNNTVSKDDTVYNLGDMFFCGMEEATSILNQLNGNIIFIQGNHDHRYLNLLGFPRQIDRFKQGKIHIVMSHFCLRVWDKSHFNSWHLFGHTHGTLKPIGKSWDVGVDNNNYRPISLDEVKAIMKNRPDNPNSFTNSKGYSKV